MNKEKIVTQGEINRRTVIAFATFILLLGGAVAGWKWLIRQPETAQVPKPLRAVLNANEKIFSSYIFSDDHLTKTYPLRVADPRTRVNGDAGMGDRIDTSAWKLHVVRHPGDTLSLSINEIRALPKTDIVFDFKCIEGWSQVTHWGGVRFSDFVKAYKLDQQTNLKYAGLITPDKNYYVGIDMKSMMHPQTLLCFELNGKPLPLNQGAPLRLIIPVKYGVKHIKRIGDIFFSNERPPDYWYEKGYDYFLGL